MNESTLKGKNTTFFIFHYSLFTKNYNLTSKLQNTEILLRGKSTK